MSESESENVWPDDLTLGDKFDFDGHTYEVVGTGPGEATADRIDNDDYTIEVGRWAFTNAVYVELEVSMSQEEFERSINPESNKDNSGGESA